MSVGVVDHGLRQNAEICNSRRLTTMQNPSADYYAHPTAIIDVGAEIHSGTKVWHFCHVMAGSTIGEGCILGQNVFVASGVTLGKGVKVQNNVSLYTGVHCEDHAFLGPSMVFTNVLNPRSDIERKDEFKATRVGRSASLGANCTIVCGNDIGDYALVGAGAVVTSDVPAFALVLGMPARIAGWVSKRGIRLSFDDVGMATCPEDGSRYQLRDDQVTEIDS